MAVTRYVLEEELERLQELLAAIVSNPPPGGFKVVNVYVNDAGRLVIEYDDTEVT